MNVFQLIGIGFIATVLSVFVKQHRPDLAVFIPITGSVIILYLMFPHLKAALNIFEDISDSMGISNQYIKIVIKVIGVAYVCQFAAELCKDAGESSIASKIEFGGKIIILGLSVPIIYSLLDLVKNIISF